MMMELAAHVFQLMILCAAAVGLAGVFMASLNDLQAVRRRARINEAKKIIHTKSAQPGVTVLVYAHNDAEMIEACLESLRHSLYGNYDLVVVDNYSQDGTRQVVRSFMQKYPRFALYMIAKRKRSTLQEAFRQAYQKSRKGEIIVTLAASSRPSPSFLHEAAARFIAEPDLCALSVNECIGTPLTIDGLVPEIVHAAGYISLKCSGLLRIRRDYIDANGVYRRDTILHLATAYVRYEGTLSLSVMHRERRRADKHPFAQVVGSLAAFLLMSYSMIAAAALISYVPLFLAWSLVTIGSLAAVWSDEGISLMRKSQLTFSSTLVYFLLYVSLLRFLLNQITRSATRLSKVPFPRRVLYIRRRAIS